MNLKQLLNQGRLRRHITSNEEIGNLLRVIERDLKDAKVEGLSSDRKFAIAYNAVLQLVQFVFIVITQNYQKIEFPSIGSIWDPPSSMKIIWKKRQK